MAMTREKDRARPSLTYQILSVFLMIILLGNLVGIGCVNLIIIRKFNTVSYYNGLRQSEILSYMLSDFYERNNHSWTGLDHFVENLPRHNKFDGRKMTRDGYGPILRIKDPPPLPEAFPFILTDLNGKILYNSTDLKMETIDFSKNKGTAVYSGSEIIAFVFTRTMVSPQLSAFEHFFLRSLNIAVILISVCTTFLFLVIGLYIIRKLLHPVRLITSAVIQIAKGDYSVRIPIQGKGEIPFLAGKFNSMTESIQRSEEWKKQIINDTAHELKTPVSVLSAKIEMIREGIYPADPDRISELYNQIGKLTQLISEMEDLSALESETVLLNKEEFPVKVLIDNLYKDFADIAAAKGIVWESYIPDVLRITADYGKMDQVFRNLITNAIDFSPEGGSIILSGFIDRDTVVLKVQDSGPGIPESEKLRIFDRFYRIEKSRDRRFGGKGLGLTIAKAIVEAHGGTIFVETSDIKGACLIVRLPVF